MRSRKEKTLATLEGWFSNPARFVGAEDTLYAVVFQATKRPYRREALAMGEVWYRRWLKQGTDLTIPGASLPTLDFDGAKAVGCATNVADAMALIFPDLAAAPEATDSGAV